jgi:hypothetical protein
MMTNSMKHVFWRTALAGAIGLLALQASAATITSQIAPGLNQFEDTDAERVLRGGNVITSGDVAVGDVFEAVLRFTDLNNTAFAGVISDIPGFGSPYQLKAYSRIRIAALLDANDNTQACASNICDIVFEADTNDGFGAMFSIYESNALAQRLIFSDSAATSIANSQLGTAVFSAGLVSGTDDFWVANDSLIDLTVVAGLTQGDQQAPNGNFGLSVIGPSIVNIASEQLTATNLVAGTQGLYDIRGTSSVYGLSTGVNSDWLVSTNTAIEFVAIPEPGSLALVGLALAAVGAMSRRRKA